MVRANLHATNQDLGLSTLVGIGVDSDFLGLGHRFCGAGFLLSY
jgi:hypothetical protein